MFGDGRTIVGRGWFVLQESILSHKKNFGTVGTRGNSRNISYEPTSNNAVIEPTLEAKKETFQTIGKSTNAVLDTKTLIGVTPAPLVPLASESNQDAAVTNFACLFLTTEYLVLLPPPSLSVRQLFQNFFDFYVPLSIQMFSFNFIHSLFVYFSILGDVFLV